MERVSFSLMQLIVESEVGAERFINPTKDHFNCIENTPLTNDGVYYEVDCDNTNEYLWLYLNYGKASPRNDKLTNINNGDKKDNTRNIDEAELLDQLFVLYSYEKKILYISNSKKRKIVELLLKQNTKQDFCIKSFYKSPTEIISILKKVDRIKFTHASNLFNQNSKERQALIDLTGTDAPETFTIEASYSTHKISSFLYSLFNGKEENKISDLVICGRDESNFNFIYNTDSFSRRIDALCEKSNESGMFNPESVKQSLLNVIKNEK